MAKTTTSAALNVEIKIVLILYLRCDIKSHGRPRVSVARIQGRIIELITHITIKFMEIGQFSIGIDWIFTAFDFVSDVGSDSSQSRVKRVHFDSKTIGSSKSISCVMADT